MVHLWWVGLLVAGSLLGQVPLTITAATTRTYTIGGVLSSDQYGNQFKSAIAELNQDMPPSIRFNSTVILMDDNPIRAAKAICDELIPKRVYVVVASHPPHSDLSPMAISFTCGFYQIPVIGITARNSAFSDKVSSAHYKHIHRMQLFKHSTILIHLE